jgi:hypothetical protein
VRGDGGCGCEPRCFLREETRYDLPVCFFDLGSFKGNVQDRLELSGKGKIAVFFSRAAPRRETAPFRTVT